MNVGFAISNREAEIIVFCMTKEGIDAERGRFSKTNCDCHAVVGVIGMATINIDAEACRILNAYSKIHAEGSRVVIANVKTMSKTTDSAWRPLDTPKILKILVFRRRNENNFAGFHQTQFFAG